MNGLPESRGGPGRLTDREEWSWEPPTYSQAVRGAGDNLTSGVRRGGQSRGTEPLTMGCGATSQSTVSELS